MSTDFIDLDGSFGEGGGQILRTSLALSLLTGKPFHLRNVRARRAKPGLQPQHLQSVQAAAAIGQARLRGASRGSCDLSFEPGAVAAGTYRFDIGTAGATGLVLHTIYLPLLLHGGAPSEVTLVGGTHVTTSPSFHFLDATWRAYLAALGLHVSLRLDRPGFYPRGGGIVRAFLQPAQGGWGEDSPTTSLPRPRGLVLPERGEVEVSGISAVAGLDRGIARRQARRALHRLEKNGIRARIDEETWEGGPGSVLVLRLSTTPAPTVFVGLGARGKPAETVADEAVEELLSYLAVPAALVDAHSADQIVLPLALAEGPSEYTTSQVTLHLTTNIAVIGRFLDRTIVCEGEIGQPGRVRIL
jgi:RNA 3'-terminal phosphate cyclase (ATP)